MIKLSGLLRAALIPGLLIAAMPAFSQSEVAELIKSSPADATKLAQAYLNPLFKGFGIGLNTGWNNTAHSKNTGRFEIRFSATGAIVPVADKSFDVTRLGLSGNVKLHSGSSPISPTVAGKNSGGTQLDVYTSGQSQPIETFTLPDGAKLPLIPAAQLQATVGLPRGIDVTLRALPKIKLGSDIGSLSMIGGGIKLELLPLISKTADKLLPVDLAVALGYTQLDYKLGLDVRPPSGSVPDGQQNQDFSNQRIDARFSGINTEIIVSKKLLFFTPFASVGFNSSKTNAGLKGNYPIVTGVNLLAQRTYTTFTDPINIKQTDVSGIKGTVGFQLNLAFLRIYASYSAGEYHSVNGGIGFGLGK